MLVGNFKKKIIEDFVITVLVSKPDDIGMSNK